MLSGLRQGQMTERQQQNPSTLEVSVNLFNKSSKVLLQEARQAGPATKTLLEKHYSKRSGFSGILKCPVS